MLEIQLPEQHLYDEKNNLFIDVPKTHLKLEHSLISLTKWEQRWHKPFLSKTDKTDEELVDYIRCMNMTPNVNPIVFYYLPATTQSEIIQYIKDPMTATWFRTDTIGAAKNNGEVVTAEVIYYWMIALNIPVEFQKWHLNQLLTLIKVVNIKNQPKKKMSQKDAAIQQRMINEQRKAKMRSRG